jgi:type I restriction enzyme S subunit
MIERPHKLPKGWRWVRLGEVAKVYAGSFAPQDQKYFENGKFPFLRVSDLSSAQGDEIRRTRDYLNDKVKALRLKRAPAGTIVFPKSGAAILTNARAILGLEAFIVSHLAAVEVDEQLAERLWVFRWLQTVDMGKLIENPSYPSLRLRKVKEVLVPLPPLAEQRRIVARVEELMARVREARRLRQQAREDAERLWQSVLAETFPRPGADLPAGWRWVRLGEVCQHLRSSIDPRQYPEEQFCLYSIPAYDNGREPEHANGEQLGSAKLRVDDGFCLFSKLNPRIPRAWVIHKAHCGGKSIASTEFMPLKPRYDLLSLDFLGLVLLTEMFLQQVRRNVSGATGSRQRLRPAVVLSALVPLPPLSEQRRIVAHLEAVQERLRALKAAQAETDEKLKQLEQSILDKAFRGEL